MDYTHVSCPSAVVTALFLSAVYVGALVRIPLPAIMFLLRLLFGEIMFQPCFLFGEVIGPAR